MTSHEYAELLQDHRWGIRRQQILDARPACCEDCGRTDAELHVHHGYYRPGRMPWDYPDSALHVLCSWCHYQEHELDKAPESNRLVKAVAGALRLTPKPKDPRAKLWEMAKANERGGVTAQQLMKLLCWLYFTRSVHDTHVLDSISRIASSARNAYAMLQPGGKTLEDLISLSASNRASEEKSEYMKADAVAGLARRQG